MPTKNTPAVIRPRRLWLKSTLVVALVAICALVGLVTATRIIVYHGAQKPLGRILPLDPKERASISEPFPLGVDPAEKTITENPTVDGFFGEHIDTQSLAKRTETGWFGRVLGRLTQSSFYQNLASPTGRILVIQSGERREEVASHFAQILNWDDAMRADFLTEVASTSPEIREGKFIPGTFVTSRSATSSEVAELIQERFQTDVLSRYTEDISAKVPLPTTLTIASLLEREAYDFEDMRYISGIIWNRIFAGMNLQLDATLQYAKGTKSASSWWPRVVPSDKYIASPYNTYKNAGLPPAPIANPSLDAILAALNPRKTDCMYYFHDKKAGFHCSVTYEEHVAQLKEYYGRGK